MPLISKSFPFQHTPSLADLHLGEGSQLQPRCCKHAISNVHPGLPNPHAVGWDFISLTLPSWKTTVCGHRWFGMFDMIIDMDWNLGSQNHKTAQPFTLLKPSPSTSPSNASTPVPPLDRRLLRGENHTQAVKAGCHPGSFGEKILSFKRRKRRVIYLLEGDTRHRRLFCRTPWHWGLICQKKYINMPKKKETSLFSCYCFWREADTRISHFWSCSSSDHCRTGKKWEGHFSCLGSKQITCPPHTKKKRKTEFTVCHEPLVPENGLV